MTTHVTATLLLCSLLQVAHAQQAALTSGGDASGSGGSASYSIGQVAYTTLPGPTASLAQGVQQPYEISVSTGFDEAAAAITLSAFPNPASDAVYLQVGDGDHTAMHYQLTDANGRLLDTGRIMSDREQIQLGAYASGTYFLSVHSANAALRTFQLVKH